MKSFSYVIKDKVGIHARPAGLLAKEAKNFKSEIIIEKDGKYVNAQKLMQIMGMGIKCGDKVTINIKGIDEEEAYLAIESFFKQNL